MLRESVRLSRSARLGLTFIATSQAGLALAQEPAFVFEGPAGAGHGASVAFAGDVNSDGYVDVIVGAPDFGTLGCAIVQSGADGSTLHTFLGVDDGGRFGFSVAGAGDVDNDGHADLIVGCLLYTSPSPRD